MISVSGHMRLCNKVGYATTSDGTAQLTLKAIAPNPSRPDGVSYLLVWTGERAACFWVDHGQALKMGTSLNVSAIEPRPLTDAGKTCIAATVLDIQINKPGTKTATKDRPVSRWVNLEGVAA